MTPTPGTATIGSTLRDRRIAAGLTQIELAELMSVSQPLISNWERDVRTPQYHMLRDLAEILDIDLNSLPV